MTDRYLIWSNEHHAWWGLANNGYVADIANAGRYDRETVLTVCTMALLGSRLGVPNEIPVREEDVIEMLTRYRSASYNQG